MKVAVSKGRSVGAERGVAGLLILLMLLLIGGAVLFSGLGTNSGVERRLALGESADVRLISARDALIGTAIGNIADASGRPGQFPAPDNLGDNNYDGNANNGSCLDSASAPNGLPALTVDSANYRCLGKLPWKTLGLSVDGVDEFDASGLVPWYAISANLSANNSCLAYLNPQTLMSTPVAYSCPSNSAPPFPWLKVCDQTGKLLSDRVAFVLIMPGPPIGTFGRTQSRTGSPRPQPGDYLDAMPMPAGWSALPVSQRCSVYDNAALTNEFVIADGVDGFNDRLVYVTIDEIVARLEERVAQQVRESLIKYQTTYSRYPWLVPIGNPSLLPDSFIAAYGTSSGLVPFESSATGFRFKTEISWNIGTSAASDSLSPTTSSSPSFLCFGGAYQCRLRTSPGSAPVPRTVSSAQLQPFKVSSVSTPSVLCAHASSTGSTTMDCDPFTVDQVTSSVTYNVQWRPCCSGSYTTYGTYAGTQTRTTTLTVSITAATGSVTTDGASFVRRSVTNGTVTSGLLAIVDKWVPSTTGLAPFDVSSGPFQTGSVSTNGNPTTVSNVRVYPVLPAWHVAHKWNEFMYAAYSSDATPSTGGAACSSNCFTAGARTGIHAIVISSGKALVPPDYPIAQNRFGASPTVADFLEPPNDTGSSTRVFADPRASPTSTYADTVVTIPR